MELLAPFRNRVEAISDMIVRHVKVDRDVSPRHALDATGRLVYVTDSVVETMPRGEGEETDVYFFRIGRFVSDDELEQKYTFHNLKPADPYSQARVNTDDPAFADDHPNGTHWKDANGKWCYAAFHRWRDGRNVYVHRNVLDWDGDWWFAGLRK